MKRNVLGLFVVGLLAVAAIGRADEAVKPEEKAEEKVEAKGDDKVKLTGDFVWNQGSEGDLEAVFTPTGSGTWDVAFSFDFRGPHTYKGTASGSLTDGALEGKVRNEDGRRTFTFEGKFAEGKFSGTHAEIIGDEPKAMGTLALGR